MRRWAIQSPSRSLAPVVSTIWSTALAVQVQKSGFFCCWLLRISTQYFACGRRYALQLRFIRLEQFTSRIFFGIFRRFQLQLRMSDDAFFDEPFSTLVEAFSHHVELHDYLAKLKRN